MKWLTIVFALYLVTLSCVPCMCADMITSDATQQIKNSKPSKEKSQDDNCTLFCTCNCCLASAFSHIKTDYITIKSIAFTSSKQFALVDKDYSSYHCHNIWQPPKLSC